MTKIGIVSCIYQNNYGSLLQSYATKEYLSSLGYDCEFVNYNKIKDIKKRKRRFYIKQILKWGYLKVKIPMLIQKIYLKTIKNTYTKKIIERYKCFNEFRKKYFDTCPEFSDFPSLSEYVYKNYFALVVGSDQLWLPANVVAGFYSLSFIDKHTGIIKLSFATSLGQSFIPLKMNNLYKSFLSDFDYISVREKEGAEFLSKIIGNKVTVISDPVFLLSKEKWMSVAGPKINSEKKIVFCYFLGNADHYLKRIKNYCETNNYEMVVLSNEERRCHAEIIANKVIYNATPFEFINMISSAELVCTDSFHCTAFSIIFEKKFVPFMKYSAKDKYSTNGRIIELLIEFGYSFNYEESEDGSIVDLIRLPSPSKDSIIFERMNKAEAFIREALGKNDNNY